MEIKKEKRKKDIYSNIALENQCVRNYSLHCKRKLVILEPFVVTTVSKFYNDLQYREVNFHYSFDLWKCVVFVSLLAAQNHRDRRIEAFLSAYPYEPQDSKTTDVFIWNVSASLLNSFLGAINCTNILLIKKPFALLYN